MEDISCLMSDTTMKYWVFHYLNIPVVARSTFCKIIRVSEDRYSWKYGYFSSDPQIFPKTCKRFGGLHQHKCRGREIQLYPGCRLGWICRTLDHSGTCNKNMLECMYLCITPCHPEFYLWQLWFTQTYPCCDRLRQEKILFRGKSESIPHHLTL